MKRLAFSLIPLVIWISLSLSFASQPQTKDRVLKAIKEIRVPFIENKGQIDDRVAFYAKTFGGTLFVTKDGKLVYNLPKYKNKKLQGGVALREILKGAKVKEVKGLEKATAKVNYFIGKDPSKWRTNIETYNMVSLGEVYKGIELELRAYGNNVEKIFKIKPKSNPEEIVLKVEGAKELKIDKETGELVVKTELGDVRFTKPVAYQEIKGKRVNVEVRYKLFSKDSYGFEVGEYDRTKVLIIDPLLASTFVGGSYIDVAYAIALDTNSVYIAGWTSSSNYPTTPGAYNNSYNSIDAFISRLDKNLTTLQASTLIGGNASDEARAIAIDTNSVYIAGKTRSSDYPTTPGAYDNSFNGGGVFGDDAFISRLDKNLTTLQASTFIGGSNDDYAHAIALDTNGVYITGWTWSSDYPTTPGAYDTSHNDGKDVFVSRLDKNLTTLQASTFIGGSDDDTAQAIALDTNSVYIAGSTGSTDYPTTPGAYDTSRNGAKDVFVSRLDKNLTTLQASTLIGGNYSDEARAIAIDTNSVYIAGKTPSSDYPTTPGAYDNFHYGNNDVFISRLDKNLTTLQASTFIGGSDWDDAWAIALDTKSVYIAGRTDSPDYPTTPGAYDTSHNGARDVFVSRLDKNLTTLQASTFIGGNGGEEARAIAIDTNSIYVAGWTDSPDYPTTSGAYDNSHNGSDAFISRLDKNLSAVAVQYTLTVNKTGAGSGTVTSNPAGINCGVDCSETYNQGTVVTLTATPDAGSVFAGWSGDCASCGNNTTCNVTMDTDKTCTAQFDPAPNNPPEQQQPERSQSKSGGCGVTPSGSLALYVLVPAFILLRRFLKVWRKI